MKSSQILVAAVAAVSFSLAAAAGAKGDIDAVRYQKSVKLLSDSKMKGRGTGSPELEKAASWIAGQFKKAGLKPAGGASYYQRFSVTTDAKLGKSNRLAAAGSTLEFQKDFQPFNFSGNGTASAGVVFAGYGITAPEYGYDDYSGVDVKDKIVLLLRHEPQEFDEKSVFAGKVYTTHAQMTNKAVNARFHGAKAVVFVNDVSNHTDADSLDRFSSNVGPNSPDIPFVQVRAEIADKWLAMAGISLKSWIAEVDRDLKPKPVQIPGLTVDLAADVVRQKKEVPNVAGYLPGVTDEYVIIGAHYDHIGMGEQSSMSPSEAGKAVHHGADDNASGSAGLVELAWHLAAQPKPRRGILFLAFAGEELGLLGSNYYVNHPLLPLDKAVAMLNMDMIGRIKDRKVFIGGTATGDGFKPLLEKVRSNTRLQLDASDQGGFGSSDHFSFTVKQVPVLFFFSGLHADYHRPSDTWEKINQDDAAELLKVVAQVTGELANSAPRPKFVKVAMPQQVASASASAGGGYGAYFGSVPDMGNTEGGFRITDVREGSPAAQAGLKGGDQIVEFGGKPIGNLYDFTYALRQHKPGDEVAIKYKRGGQVFDTKATLTARK
jgi:hypothetical protein